MNMKISTRIILLLTITVSAVMMVANLVTLRQREASLREGARDEVRIHAVTLQIALEEDYRTGRTLDAQRWVARLRENIGLYSLILFDATGNIVALSNTGTPDEFQYLNEARQVIAIGNTIEIGRVINKQEYYSIIKPLRVDGQPVGAVELVQPISFVRAHIARARWHTAFIAVLLYMTIFVVVAAVTHYSLARPIRELLGGAQAVGRGDLDYRVIVPPSGGELAELAREFNRMADSLAEQRRRAAQEAEQRLTLERELRHSERLAVLGRVAAGIAHEMGAPLQVIDGRAKQLLNNLDAAPATRERHLTLIRAQAERITRIVRQLLNLARPYHPRRQPLVLTQLIKETTELLEAEAEAAQVELQIAPDHQTMVEADPDLLQQVLLNICRNGLQAMPHGGRLRIECDSAAEPRDGRNFAAVRIADTGSGIAAEHLERIFDPFFTTKEVGAGTGLGLVVASRIVEEHGGWIAVANAPSGGAVFTIYLPQPTPTERGTLNERTTIDRRR
jgi:signal transduction histidine kinase